MQRQRCRYTGICENTRGQINVTDEIVESPCTCSIHHIGFIIFSYNRRAGISQFLKREIRTRSPRLSVQSFFHRSSIAFLFSTNLQKGHKVQKLGKDVGKLSRKLLYTLDCSFRVTTVTGT